MMIVSAQTHRDTQDEQETVGVYPEHQYCGTVCFSYRTRDSHSVEIQATKTHLFSADCTQTILFISCKREKKGILKN